MVSFWPWRGDDTSPASFEKTLASLSGKASKTTARLDLLHQRSRRLKALWTLYTIFAYILYSIVLVLVWGWRNWGPAEYTAVAGGPLVIYVVRLALTTYYEFRISHVQAQLDDIQKQREMTIEKLKAATKYNSTQQLLDKYGGSPRQSPKASSSAGGTPKRRPGAAAGSPGTPKGGRTGVPPPPTANIPRNNGPPPLPTTPQRPSSSTRSPLGKDSPTSRADSPASITRTHPEAVHPGEPEFAPNAFPAPSQYSGMAADGPRWYDRVMDVILGEDETLPKNRLVLICQHCKLVAGQAPPGVRRLEDIGKWRCGGCGGWNGVEDEVEKIKAEVHEEAKAGIEGKAQLQNSPSLGSEAKTVADRPGSEITDDENFKFNASSTDEVDDESEEAEPTPPPKPKRGRPKRTTSNKG